MNSVDTMIQTALEVTATACGVARAVQADLERVRHITKDDRSPVTVADFAVQAYIAHALDERLGSVLIVGEEHADELRKPDQKPVLDAVIAAVHPVWPSATEADVLDAIDAGRHDGSADAYWTLDPIDGTKGFLRGQQYAIALGYLEGGKVVLGAMGCPNLPVQTDRPLDVADARGVVYGATLDGGSGCWSPDSINTSPASVQCTSFDPDAPIRVCGSVEAAHSSRGATARIIEQLGRAGEPARLDSQCKYAIVARGQADAYLRMPTRQDYQEKIWDHAAGSIIATEAGAVVSDITGKPLDFTHGALLSANRGVICAAAGLHERIIAAISDLGLAG